MVLTRRLVVPFAEQDFQMLRRGAVRRGWSMSHLIREAIRQ